MAEPALRIASRGSALALVQAQLVAGRLQAAWPGLQIAVQVVRTEGDRRSAAEPRTGRDAAEQRGAAAADRPDSPAGRKGSFTAEVQRAVLDGGADLAVHSAKDLPAGQPAGLVIAAVPARGDPRDALVGPTGPLRLADLRPGAAIGSASPRRAALLRHLRPDLRVVALHGNVDTRLRKLRDGAADAVVLAVAGLVRLGHQGLADLPLDPDDFVPAPGQGCLAVEARAGDRATIELLRAIDDPGSALALQGERAFLARLGGSCELPAGALLTTSQRPGAGGADVASVRLNGFLATEDGAELVRRRVLGPAGDAERLGARLAEELVAAGSDRLRGAVGAPA